MSRLGQLAALVSALLFGAIAATFGANIVARYAFARPIIWADELAVLLLLWTTFLTAAFVIQEREQVVFDLLYERAGPAGRRFMLLGGSALLALILLAALPAILSYTAFLWRERTNVLELRLDVAYSCFALFIAVLVLRRLAIVARLLGRDWRRAVAETEGPGTE